MRRPLQPRSLTLAERAMMKVAPDTAIVPLFKQGATTAKRKTTAPSERKKRQHQEAQRQAAIVAALRRYGYMVYPTDEHRRPVQCPCGCGEWFTPPGVTRPTAGLGDLAITACWWPPATWHFQEVKPDASAKVRDEQKRLAELGRQPIVWTVEMSLDELDAFERRIADLTDKSTSCRGALRWRE